MIFISLKRDGALLNVAPHIMFAGEKRLTSLSQINIDEVHNAIIAKALGHGQAEKHPGGGYGLKFMRNKRAGSCVEQLEKARDALAEHGDEDGQEFTYLAMCRLVYWAKANPDAIFIVT